MKRNASWRNACCWLSPSSFDSNRRAVKYQLKASDIKRCLHQNDTFPAVSLKKFKDEPFCNAAVPQ